jgi:DMSO reductase family type II enzyme chaperone
MQTASQTQYSLEEARAGAYALIASGFRYPTMIPLAEMSDAAFWERLCKGFAQAFKGESESIKGVPRLEAGAASNSGTAPLPEACRALRKAIDKLRAENTALDDAVRPLEDEYAALFGHAVRGACPPYELEYGPGEIVQRAPDLADIAGFYNAFGLEMAADSDRPDHITAECEFMSLLCTKEAAASGAGLTEHAEQCRAAQRSFLKDHLSCWLPALTQRITERAGSGFYADLARFARAFIEFECHRFELPLGPVWLELRPVDPDRDAQIECGPEDRVPGGSDRLVQLNVSTEA